MKLKEAINGTKCNSRTVFCINYNGGYNELTYEAALDYLNLDIYHSDYDEPENMLIIHCKKEDFLKIKLKAIKDFTVKDYLEKFANLFNSKTEVEFSKDNQWVLDRSDVKGAHKYDNCKLLDYTYWSDENVLELLIEIK